MRRLDPSRDVSNADIRAILERSVALSATYSDPFSRAESYAELAEAQLARGDVESAEYYERKSVYVREELRMLKQIADTRAKAAALRAELRSAS